MSLPAEPVENWVPYRHPGGLFALAYPAGWRAIASKSDVACRSMAGPRDHCFFEVMALAVPESHRSDAATVVKDLVLGSLREEHSRSLTVLADEPLPGGGARLVVEHLDGPDQGPSLATTDMFMRSNGSVVVSINFSMSE
jgi:hypothetical protein